MAMGQNPVPLVNIKIAGKWVFIPLKSMIGGFDTHLYVKMSYTVLYSYMYYMCVCVLSSVSKFIYIYICIESMCLSVWLSKLV